jgi:hypothetical protein
VKPFDGLVKIDGTIWRGVDDALSCAIQVNPDSARFDLADKGIDLT